MKLGEITLKPQQAQAVDELENGSLLVAGVGSGKTYVAIFWAQKFGLPIYVITTAAKRDKIAPGHDKPDWQESLDKCGIKHYVVDSWNNINNYKHVKQAVFVFDEQKVIGRGSWAKAFVHIAKQNFWMLASATPGDNWENYISVFLAHGFYRNITEFRREHVEYDRFAKYPKIKAFHKTAYLEKLRRSITVVMVVPRDTVRHVYPVYCGYDLDLNKSVENSRWNPYTDAPIQTPSEFTQVMRRLVSEHHTRKTLAERIFKETKRLIVFYNYDYERDMIIALAEKLGKPWGAWNGTRHDLFPDTEEWIYLVQYNSNEGWECIKTDTMLFWSPNYSWKCMEQCMGRIDRMNTPYTDLYYHIMQSYAKIDRDVVRAIATKHKFNEGTWGKQALEKR